MNYFVLLLTNQQVLSEACINSGKLEFAGWAGWKYVTKLDCNLITKVAVKILAYCLGSFPGFKIWL